MYKYRNLAFDFHRRSVIVADTDAIEHPAGTSSDGLDWQRRYLDEQMV